MQPWVTAFHQWAIASRTWPTWLRYLITTITVVAVFTLVRGSSPDQDDVRLVFFLPVVLLTGALLDRGNGLYATVLFAILIVYSAPELPPSAQEQSTWSFVTFIALGVSISLVVEALHMGLVVLSTEHQFALDAARDRQVLLHELSHRTRNDLVNLATLLTLQARSAEGETATALTTAANRVRAVARVHRTLSLVSDHVVVDSKIYIGDLCDELRQSLSMLPIRIEWKAESHLLALGKAVPIGLILNESVTNAVKHAFVDQPSGTIEISFSLKDEVYELSVADNGIGVTGKPREGSLGTRLISLLSAQLGGEATVEKRSTGGTRVLVTFPRITEWKSP